MCGVFVSSLGRRSFSDLTEKIVYLNPKIEAFEPHYLGADYFCDPTYKGEPFQKHRMMIHDILHPFIGIDDLDVVHKE